MSQTERIRDFITRRISETQQSHLSSTDPMDRLQLAISQASFAHLLNQYVGVADYMFESLYQLARAYLDNESYGQALINARLAKKQAGRSKPQQTPRAELLIAECLLKQGKIENAHEMLLQLEELAKSEGSRQNYYELLLMVLVHLKQENKVADVLKELETVIRQKYGDKSIEYGFYLIEKGKSYSKFGHFELTIQSMSKGLQILIERKCKEKKKITEVYLGLADSYRKTNSPEKEYSSLICAYSMAKQLDNSQREVVNIVHLLATNLADREENEKALKELKKAKNLEKQLYGQSSVHLGRTVKKIIGLLQKMGLKAQAKKYQLEYSRVVGSALNERPSNVSGSASPQ